MSADSTSFIGTIPRHYDSGLGPHLFFDFATDLAARATALGPRRVLEIAAGTGIVTRKLRDALPSSCSLIATDLNPPMLEIAREKFSANDAVHFQPADAMSLPFANGECDLVVCQFGVMFFPDKEKAYRETYRVLSPGGHYLFNVWDSLDYNPSGALANRVIDSFFESDPPSFYNVPYGFSRIDPIKASLISAGFDDISINVLRRVHAIPRARLFAEGLVLGNPAFVAITERGKAAPERVVEAMTEALHQEFGIDPGRFPLQAIVFSARKR
jgi:SAM-dependent methyltransferase